METAYQIKRSTAIYMVVFLVICFAANFVAFFILVKNTNSLLQGMSLKHREIKTFLFDFLLPTLS